MKMAQELKQETRTEVNFWQEVYGPTSLYFRDPALIRPIRWKDGTLMEGVRVRPAPTSDEQW